MPALLPLAAFGFALADTPPVAPTLKNNRKVLAPSTLNRLFHVGRMSSLHEATARARTPPEL